MVFHRVLQRRGSGCPLAVSDPPMRKTSNELARHHRAVRRRLRPRGADEMADVRGRIRVESGLGEEGVTREKSRDKRTFPEARRRQAAARGLLRTGRGSLAGKPPGLRYADGADDRGFRGPSSGPETARQVDSVRAGPRRRAAAIRVIRVTPRSLDTSVELSSFVRRESRAALPFPDHGAGNGSRARSSRPRRQPFVRSPVTEGSTAWQRIS